MSIAIDCFGTEYLRVEITFGDSTQDVFQVAKLISRKL